MQINPELIESLLYEEEGNALDFKEEQYRFTNGTDDQKSELLKDLLAFANAFRRTDAYILIGVREVKGGRSVVLGVAEQLEDAHLQQFVSSKTQKPLTFVYRAAQHDGIPIGIIHIPRQPRPLYAIRVFGKVRKEVVYHRRGSSTAVATPEEIAQMGVADQLGEERSEPQLQLRLVKRLTRLDLGTAVRLDIVRLNTPELRDIPDYAEGTSGGFSFPNSLTGVQRNYWRELVQFTRMTHGLRPLSLAVNNLGPATARDVRLVFDVANSEGVYRFIRGSDLPEAPVRVRNPLYPDFRVPAFSHSIHVDRRGDSWHVDCSFGKLQPQETGVLPEDLYVGANESGELQLKCELFADNLARPTPQKINITFSVSRRKVTLDEIKAIEAERFANSPGHRRFIERLEEADGNEEGS